MTDHTGTMAGAAPDARNGPADAGLVMVHAAELGASPRVLALSAKVHIVGRVPGPGGFALSQSAVSRMHTSLSVDRDGVRIRDMGSRNGTWVNGERITEKLLRRGDDVRIGDVLFVFVEDDAHRHAAYSLDGRVAAGAPAIAIPGVAGGWSMARLGTEVQARAATKQPTLVVGETGTGKDLVARAIHAAARRAGRLEVVRCAAPAAGKDPFAAARDDTLLLDEVADLDPHAQGRLLAILDEEDSPAVVCTTHRDLPRLVREEKFRVDLFARLATGVIQVPPLRDRREDLFLLVRHLLDRFDASHLAPTVSFMEKLLRHDWPFNVRELAAVVEAAAREAGTDARELDVQHLPKSWPLASAPASVAPTPVSRPGTPSGEELARLLKEHQGNVASVARELARDPAQIYRWLKKYALDPNAFR